MSFFIFNCTLLYKLEKKDDNFYEFYAKESKYN